MTSLGNKVYSDDFYWEIKTWETSAGEMRLRIFNLLGNDLVGENVYPAGEIRSLGCMPIYWGSWGN